MSDFVKAEEISRNRVRYTDSSGKVFIYSKGTWAWRNNNPGNIRKPSKKNMPTGVIGLAGGFLVFSTYEAGFSALQTLLKKDYYQNLTIFDTVAQYAPTEEISKKKILDIKKNKQNLIIQYLIEGYGWLRKSEAINLVEKDIVDAVVVKRQNGYVFLRSRPDSTKTNNLDK